MKNLTCCFTGHRKIPKNEYNAVKARLKQEITALIQRGVIYFGTGGALGFDTMAALAVLELREIYPQIKLILVLPCKNQTRGWSVADIATYERIKKSCDKYVYVCEEYSRDCVLKRNRHLVNYSRYCICYLKNQSGGTAYTVQYATNCGLTVINIA